MGRTYTPRTQARMASQPRTVLNAVGERIVGQLRVGTARVQRHDCSDG